MAESVLLVGSGGREHALAMEMAVSPHLDGTIYCVPGNPGTAQIPNIENVPIGAGDIGGIVDFASEHRSGLTVVVGSEALLVAGLGDRLRVRDIPVFGPNTDGAKLEASKAFARDFMTEYDIPQPDSGTARTLSEAWGIIGDRRPEEVVLKADGLAGGKGVVLPETDSELTQVLYDMLSGHGFDGAGRKGIVIQERLTGPELSVFVVSDGEGYRVIPHFAQDHKRRDEGDQGPNTGGMGAYTVPKYMVSDQQMQQIHDIARRTMHGMADRGTPYKGVLYMGLMLAKERQDDPVVIEYNVRFGDPEAQVILPTLTATGTDVYEMVRETARGNTADIRMSQHAGRAALTVCLATNGYPENPQKGALINGLGVRYPNVTIHHGGTEQTESGIVTASGRALYVTGYGKSVDVAAQAAYAAIGQNGVNFDGMHYRKDIGHQVRRRTR